MPAPTALRKTSEAPAEDQTMAELTPLPAEEEQTELLDMNAVPSEVPQITAETPAEDMTTDESGRPKFPAALSTPLAFRRELRKVPIPPHRLSPLKTYWAKIYPPLVEVGFPHPLGSKHH